MLSYHTSIGFLLTFLLATSAVAQQNMWTVKQCIEQGWKANTNIQKSELNKINAKYDLEINRANYHPSLNASYANSYNWGRSIDPTSYRFVQGLVNTNNISLSGNMTIFDGFATPTKIRQSKVGLQLAEGQLEQEKNRIAINITGAYLQTLLAHERIELISNQLIASRKLLLITSRYFELGLKSEGEVLQIKSQIAKEVSDSIQSDNTLQLSKLMLLQLMEMPFSNDFDIERFNPELVPSFASLPSTNVIHDSALTMVPEIKNAHLNISYYELELKVRKGNYYPILSLNGRIGSNYASTSKIINQEVVVVEKQIGYLASDPMQTVVGNEVTLTPVTSDYSYADQVNDNLSSSVSIALSIPIYNRKQTKMSVAKTNVSLDKAKLDLKNQKNVLRKDIESDYLEYFLLNNQLEASEQQLKAHKEAYQKILKQFELQLSNSYELTLEKNRMLMTESEIVQLKYQRLFKYIILRYYQSGQVELPAKQ